MKVDKNIFLHADRDEQMVFMWDKLEEIQSTFKSDRKKRYTITAVSGFVGGSVTMLTFQAKMLWKSIIGG